MHHPIAIAIGAASTTVLAAAMRDGNSALFFLAFGVLCFVLAATVQDEAIAESSRPLFFVVPGALLLAAAGCMLRAHPGAPAAPAMLTFGMVYFALGMASWVRARYS